VTAFDLSSFAPPLVIPVLSSPPVVLRPYSMADIDLVRAASTDPLIPSITSVPRRFSHDAGRSFIQRQWERAGEGDGYSFVICDERSPDEGIGSIGLWLHEIESGRASIGYWIVTAARGHGRAAQALRAVVAFAFEHLAIPRLHLFVEPWNVASSRTALSAGFVREATLRGWERIDGEQHDVDSYALLREEWAGGPP
jgi:RimJ/RimL family protein N-acetyltransferase